MEKTLLTKKSKIINRKNDRELLLTVSVFLLNQEELRKQFWTVKSISYDKVVQVVKVGINTTNGKLGTTLAKLRKTSRNLSDYLYDQGITFRKTKIIFYVDKEDIEIERIYNLLAHIENKKED
jgi:hypothetical protein